uniref:SFRICE_007837 n=1 Tax=Spodoptera frugiperda TaxID=7108 RepID=A0A2H1WVE2_SPOFR
MNLQPSGGLSGRSLGYVQLELRQSSSQHLLKMLRGGARHVSSGILHVMCVFYVAPLLHEHLIAGGEWRKWNKK